jgi:hypothetical protein
MKKTNENDSEEDSEEENEEKRNLELYLEDNIDKNIERMEKKVEKYDKEVKTQIALSKNGQNKEKHKKEAISALKKKKFYEKNLKKLQDKKLTIEIKIMDIDIKKQKKELKKITNDFKRKVAILINPDSQIANIQEDIGSEDGFEKLNIDMSEEEVEKQFNQIISLPEVKQASENLNMFKYIFQSD